VSHIDFDLLRRYTEIPSAAEQLLSKPEREMYFNLTLKLAPDQLLQADSYLVLYNTARGPAKGGLRMAPNVTLEETRDLAERMVWKTALARIPFGGGKSGIAISPQGMPRFQKTAVIKEYVHMLALELRNGTYIPAPDMGTNETDMAVIFGELHIPECVTGKPPRVGGLPGRREATGCGVSHVALRVLKDVLKTEPVGASAAAQGFGNVGSHVALFLYRAGVKVVAASDITGGRADADGLDIPLLVEHCRREGSLEGAPGKRISNAELLASKVDVLCPCACENQITADNARRVRARVIVEGANGPTTPEADAILEERKIPTVPDILANAGGVIASYVEWRQGKSGAITEIGETLATVEGRLSIAFEDMLRVAAEKGCSLRTACQVSAAQELVASLRDRDWI